MKEFLHEPFCRLNSHGKSPISALLFNYKQHAQEMLQYTQKQTNTDPKNPGFEKDLPLNYVVFLGGCFQK